MLAADIDDFRQNILILLFFMLWKPGAPAEKLFIG